VAKPTQGPARDMPVEQLKKLRPGLTLDLGQCSDDIRYLWESAPADECWNGLSLDLGSCSADIRERGLAPTGSYCSYWGSLLSRGVVAPTGDCCSHGELLLLLGFIALTGSCSSYWGSLLSRGVVLFSRDLGLRLQFTPTSAASRWLGRWAGLWRLQASRAGLR
jgi:hypothetical protein